MNSIASIDFVLRGRLDGVDISPRTIGSLFEPNNQKDLFDAVEDVSEIEDDVQE